MSLLFSPISIKNMTLKNRVVFPPIATSYGLRNDRARYYCAERARGGAGLIILQGTPVDMLISDEWTAGLKPVVDSIHELGAAIGIQLWMGNQLPGGEQVAPSPREGHREITASELNSMTERFARAARNARDIGFDTVDLHGAHGYFLHQFFSPLTNRRTDLFGGSLQNRIAFPLSCARAVREEVGKDYPIMYRFSAMEGAPGGITLDDSLVFARELESAGVDILDVSAGQPGDPVNLSIPGPDLPLGTHADLAGAIKQVVGIPVVAVGRFNTFEVCENALSQGKADLIAVGRQLLADPDWPLKLQENREAEVVECDSCNALCYGNRSRNKPMECVVNPDLGREYLRFQKS